MPGFHRHIAEWGAVAFVHAIGREAHWRNLSQCLVKGTALESTDQKTSLRRYGKGNRGPEASNPPLVESIRLRLDSGPIHALLLPALLYLEELELQYDKYVGKVFSCKSFKY